MHAQLALVQFVLVSSTPALFALISFLLIRLLKVKKIYQAVIQSYALFVGFVLCIFLFGMAILVAEFACWNTHKLFFIVYFKFTIILNFLCWTAIPLCGICCYSSCTQHSRGLKFMLCTILPVLLICCFVVQWAIMSSFATFLLSLAYPLHVTTLVVLNFAFMFALSVTFGVFVSETTSINFKFKKICTYNCTCAGICCIFYIIVILAIAIPLYITIICGYAFTIVQRIVPADGLIHQGLLFLPSLILFLIGWLLKKNYFGMYS